MEVKERLYRQEKEMAAINEQNEIPLNQALEMVEFDHCLRVCDRHLRPPTIIRTLNTGDLLGAAVLTQNSNM